ncbi:MAG: isoprenylcysteine carboxylmethyltransferase family protein [Bacteroidota bacterium]
MNLNLVSKVGLVMAILAVVLLVFQESLLAAGVIAISIQIAAALLMFWARLTFGRRSFHATAAPTEGELVTSGPYRYLRHPIYASLLYFIWAGVLSHLSVVSILLGVVATAGLIFRMVSEERLLLAHYPEYAAYASRTRRIIPFVL